MVSKFSGALLNMVNDFANINHSPDYNAKSKKKLQNPTINAMKRMDRRHSLNLAVGVSDEMPPFTPFTEKKNSGRKEKSAIENARNKGRRQSAPVISNSNTYDNLHMRLSELKETSSLKDGIHEEFEKGEPDHSPKRVLQHAVSTDLTSQETVSKKKSSQSDIVEKHSKDFLKPEGFDSIQKAKIMYCKEQRASVVFIDDDITKPMCGTGSRT